ncbi:DeoR/GlpR family DNA-binding transcription regulator [Paraburkholderia sp. DHOC27]|uniref:DeoR/GlpR family DNA-binding transcription regulator n=1 Tax=Paraburkholderia sp. DHOC27 TaxID=2303330 RepID=UPI000E3BFC05|nr:DeoR/GlpR family DNA-binding transcription regulator [Paraburkholderia sp. DHOC27]RFU49741.1 DeoR/GlpR transcriptional regulator [Paraburkholderia sp. DHOC27]
MKTNRLEAIRHHLYSNGETSIQALADGIGASLATVRRDLQILEQQGVVERSHGGARISSGVDTEVAFEVRENQHLREKRAIAAAAYDLLTPNSAVFLDAGTTVLQLAHLLRVNPIPLTVVTNGLVVAQRLMNVPKLRVSLIGGQLRNENASLVGPAAELALDRLWLDQLFLGAGAIGDDHKIYSLDSAEASINEHMIGRAASTIVLADASKFGRRSTFLVAELTSRMHVISDSSLADKEQSGLRKAGINLTTVESKGTEVNVKASAS